MAERTIIVTSADATTVRYQTDATTVVTTDATGPQGPQGAPGTGIEALTTKGDLLGFSTEGARIPVGANGTVLVADSTQALGVKWDSGAQGPQGAQGAQGPQGANGSNGAAGAQGAQGAQGPQGADGAAGAQGAQGANGAGDAYNATASKYGAGPTKSLFWPGAAFGSWAGSAAMVADTLHYQPGYAAKSITLSAIKFEVFVAASAGKVMRVGLYVADDDWQPTTLIVDSGAIAADSTGVKTFSTSAVVPAGRILAALHSDGAPQLRICTIPVWGQIRGDLFGGGANICHNGWLNKSSTYGALPSTGLAWTTMTASESTSSMYCAVLLEAASYS